MIAAAHGDDAQTTISNTPQSNPSRRPSASEGEAVPTITVPGIVFKPGTRVVVAEDDRVSQAVLTMILQKFGLEVHVASDGMRALELIREMAPALVMMDMQMPLMDGEEAIRKMREDVDAPQPPVVVLSANRMPQAQVEALRALGVIDCLLKPVNRGRLQSVLAQVLPQA